MSRSFRWIAALLAFSGLPCQAAEIPSAWVAQAREHAIEAEYEITWQEREWQAPNREQGFRTYFTAAAIRLVPLIEDPPSWDWGLQLVRWGRVGSTRQSGPPEPVGVTGREATYARCGIVERYVNTPDGLEHPITIHRRPEGASGHQDRQVHLDLALSGTLSPSIAEDGQAIDFATQTGVRVLRSASLRVVDTTGQVLPARMEGLAEAGLRGIRLAFDDVDAVYPVTVESLTTGPAWTAEGNQATAWFGYSVATAGDVNGDGYSDVIVSAALYDNGQSNEGRAFVHLGTAAGLSATAAWTAEGDQASALFGTSVASAGDVNGDGYDDVVVGAYTYDNGQIDEGRAFVYHGSSTGLSGSPAWTAESNQANAWFGWSVSGAGDVNGDGYADVVVGAYTYDNGQTDEGRSFVYLGSASGLAGSPAWTAESDQAGASAGYSVATAGDVNGDGYADVIVGAYAHNNDVADEGRAFVYLGSASGLASSPAWTAEGNQASSWFGISVSTAGDVNGDGYADVVVGAYGFDNGQTDEGRAFVYLGSASGLAGSPAWTAEGDQSGAQLGISVAAAGDINGDGYADIVVGADGFDNGQADEGRALVYLGSSSGLATSATWTVESDQAGAQFGYSTAAAGDVDGDGYSDVIVGAYGFDNDQANEGRAFVHLGSASGLADAAGWTEEGDQVGGTLGISVASAGDVNGDGYSDVIVGAPGFDGGATDEGGAYVYLGSASGPAVSPAWTAEGQQAGAQFGFSVGGAGDVNGDGYSDVIVGAYGFDTGAIDDGRAYVYLGSSAGVSGSPAWTAESQQAGAEFGFSVGTAGDVNGDGYSDIIVGARRYDNGEPEEGRAYVYLGSASGLAASPAWTAEGQQVGALFGISAGSAGDVNGDGYSDVVVGAFAYDGSFTDEGQALVYLGSAAGLAGSPAWTTNGGQVIAYLGRSVGGAGDVNGDGYSDIIVGAYGFDNDQINEGRTFVYLGSASGLASSAAWTAEGDQSDASHGSAVCSAGDVNGDGYSDVIVGAIGYSNGQTAEGRARVFLGSASGLAGSSAWSSEGDQLSALFGFSACGAGDVNGDGYSDIVVGAPHHTNGQGSEGRASVFLGGGGRGLERIARQARTNGTTPVALLGRSDAETTFRLRARGRTPAGRGVIRLQWEVQPLAAPFDGSGGGESAPLDTGPPTSLGSATNFNEPVTGLDDGTFYHWRMRTVTSNPLFPRSPWISLAGNNRTETKLRTPGCVDRDGDGYGDLGDPACTSQIPDCDDHDPEKWSVPGETANLRFLSKTVLTWTPPAAPGALTSVLVYDTLRSGLAADFLLADCLESDNGPNTTATDIQTPSTGQAFFYLNRAQNACAAGAGTLGTDSNGVEQVGAACP